MSSRGTSSLSAGPGKCFAFIDADNVAKGFVDAFKHRDLVSEGEKYFSLELLLRRVPAYRKYLFSAAPEGGDTHDWLVRLRSEQSFIYRQGKLIEKNGRAPKQQGVDVMIAVEALRCAHSKIMESCIIFSDDGDLLPLVSALVDLGIHTSVFAFGNPLLGKVSQELQDSCDNYVHIGDTILSHAITPSGSPKMTGNCNKPMLSSFGVVEDLVVGDEKFAVVFDERGGVYICNVPYQEISDYGQNYYVYYPEKDAAFARFKLTGSFF